MELGWIWVVLIVLLVGCCVVLIRGCGILDHRLSRSFCSLNLDIC